MKQKKPKVFGKRPILMQRWDGGIRIIYPDGKVKWAAMYSSEVSRMGCTNAKTQRQAYQNCLLWDRDMITSHEDNFSAFLGYL